MEGSRADPSRGCNLYMWTRYVAYFDRFTTGVSLFKSKIKILLFLTLQYAMTVSNETFVGSLILPSAFQRCVNTNVQITTMNQPYYL